MSDVVDMIRDADQRLSRHTQTPAWGEVQVMLRQEALLLRRLETELKSSKEQALKLNVIQREMLALEAFVEKYRRVYANVEHMPETAKEFLLRKMHSLSTISAESSSATADNNSNSSSLNSFPSPSIGSLSTPFDVVIRDNHGLLRREKAVMELMSELRHDTDLIVRLLEYSGNRRAVLRRFTELCVFSLYGSVHDATEDSRRIHLLLRITGNPDTTHLAPRIITTYVKFAGGRRFVREVLERPLRRVVHNERLDFEHSSGRVRQSLSGSLGSAAESLLEAATASVAVKNRYHLLFYANKVMKAALKGIHGLSAGVQILLREAAKGGSGYTVINVMFYSLLIPAIVHPELAGLFLEDHLSQRVRRNLLLLAKEIQRAVQRYAERCFPEELTDAGGGSGGGVASGGSSSNNSGTGAAGREGSSAEESDGGTAAGGGSGSGDGSSYDSPTSSNSEFSPASSPAITSSPSSFSPSSLSSALPKDNNNNNNLNNNNINNNNTNNNNNPRHSLSPSSEEALAEQLALLDRRTASLIDTLIQPGASLPEKPEATPVPKTVVISEDEAEFLHRLTAEYTEAYPSRIPEDHPVRAVLNRLGPVPPSLRTDPTADNSAYLVFFARSDSLQLQRDFTEIQFPVLNNYERVGGEAGRATAKLHAAMVKMDSLGLARHQRSHLSLLDVLHDAQAKAVTLEETPLAMCLREVSLALDKLAGSWKLRDWEAVKMAVLGAWEGRSVVRDRLRSQIETIHMHQAAMSTDLGAQLRQRSSTAATLWVQQALSSNAESINKFVSRMGNTHVNNSGEIPFYIRSFLNDSPLLLLLHQRAEMLKTFIHQLFTKQHKAESRTPQGVYEIIERYVHSRVCDMFIVDTTQDQELCGTMTKHQPDSLAEWWNSEDFEGSPHPWKDAFDERSLKPCIKAFIDMLSIRNPKDKLGRLVTIRESLIELFNTCAMDVSSDNLNKIFRFIIWRSKPQRLMANMQFINLFMASEEEVELGSMTEKLLSDFEFCAKAIEMICEQLNSDSQEKTNNDHKTH